METKRLLNTPNDHNKWFEDVVKPLGLCSTPKPRIGWYYKEGMTYKQMNDEVKKVFK